MTNPPAQADRFFPINDTSYRSRLLDPPAGLRPASGDPWDGPVDQWVDDVDNDWDDFLVPDLPSPDGPAAVHLVIEPFQATPEGLVGKPPERLTSDQ